MSKNRGLGHWLALLLAPLIPVLLLYIFFGNQNYFELKDTAKGLVATGPIAAYVFIVWVGSSVWGKYFVPKTNLQEELRVIEGKWKYKSTSSHGTEFSGECDFAEKDGELEMNGDVLVGGKNRGQWCSLSAQENQGVLLLVYEMQEVGDAGVTRREGLARLRLPHNEKDAMTGTWAVLGADVKAGTITFSR